MSENGRTPDDVEEDDDLHAPRLAAAPGRNDGACGRRWSRAGPGSGDLADGSKQVDPAAARPLRGVGRAFDSRLGSSRRARRSTRRRDRLCRASGESLSAGVLFCSTSSKWSHASPASCSGTSTPVHCRRRLPGSTCGCQSDDGIRQLLPESLEPLHRALAVAYYGQTRVAESGNRGLAGHRCAPV